MLRRLAKDSLLRRAGKRVPVLKYIYIAEAAMAAHKHYTHLDLAQRQRLRHLLVKAGKQRSLSQTERQELKSLLLLMEPRKLAYTVADTLSPVPLPKRLAGKTPPPHHPWDTSPHEDTADSPESENPTEKGTSENPPS